MIYKNLMECVNDLEKNGHLLRIKEEIDPHLEAAEIHRRIYDENGPAVFFENLKGSMFPAVTNLFGTSDRARFIFRDTLPYVKQLVRFKSDPGLLLKKPFQSIPPLMAGVKAFPLKKNRGGVLYGKTELEMLPRIKCWPEDGGAFILLPQVYSEDPHKPGIMHSNLGMYRVQLSGNEYQENEVGIHYQIKRDIGVHHMNAIECGKPLKVSVFVGGPPAHSLAAVMPLPEHISELLFAGVLSGRRFRYTEIDGYKISLDADFCITGTIDPEKTKPEGPFGDHLGYYSLTHEFPYMKVESVYYRKNAVWPFTVVGRPPQEDSVFGEIIHEITEPAVPVSIPGVDKIHAVDAAGVHPLLLAIGRESYIPYGEKKPLELLTLANAILGYGQCSLAKYLFIVSRDDAPVPNIHDECEFFSYVLERVDFTRDLHFQTCTTMDTLDYSGNSLNSGSKLVCTVRGEQKRTLDTTVPYGLNMPSGFKKASVVSPGILIVEAPEYREVEIAEKQVERFIKHIKKEKLSGFPLIVICNDSDFTSHSFSNFLWVTFTRSNPSHDINGIDQFTDHKHWGCSGPLIIDARLKPHHAKPLSRDPGISDRVDQMFKKSGILHGSV